MGMMLHRRGVLSAGATPAFQQILDLATADGWTAVYDPTNPNTRTLRNDGADDYISALADGLGNLPDFVQATAANQPKLLVGQFGDLDGGDFPGNEFLQWGDLENDLGATPLTYAYVYKADDNSGNEFYFGTETSAGEIYIEGASANMRFKGSVNYDAFPTDLNSHVVSVLFDGASSEVHQDDALFTGDTGAATFGRLRMGKIRDASNENTQGKIGVLVVADSGISSAARQRMRDLLHDLTGIAKA